MKSLVELLDKLNAREDLETLLWPKDPCDYKRYFNMNLEDTELNDAERKACELLITEGGSVNWDNVRQLKAMGYNVYAGERDSFGWLTGCIEHKDTHTVLVFG